MADSAADCGDEVVADCGDEVAADAGSGQAGEHAARPVRPGNHSTAGYDLFASVDFRGAPGLIAWGGATWEAWGALCVAVSVAELPVVEHVSAACQPLLGGWLPRDRALTPMTSITPILRM